MYNKVYHYTPFSVNSRKAELSKTGPSVKAGRKHCRSFFAGISGYSTRWAPCSARNSSVKWNSRPVAGVMVISPK